MGFENMNSKQQESICAMAVAWEVKVAMAIASKKTAAAAEAESKEWAAWETMEKEVKKTAEE